MSPELRKIGQAAQDPAITFFALLPLALVHLSGRDAAPNGAYSLVGAILEPLGLWAVWGIAGVLAVLLLWAIGRIRLLELPWAGGASLTLVEGAVWGMLMGPLLAWLTDLVAPGTEPPLAVGAASEFARVHGSLALAAGAGLYEELVFRAILLTGLTVLFRNLLSGLGWKKSAPLIGFVLGLLISSAAFALAHKLGDPSALDSRILAFRFLAGLLLGGLYAWRGLAVVAYAHAAYDAYLLLL